MGQIRTAYIAQFSMLQVLPDSFVGIQVGRIRRKVLQMNVAGTTIGQGGSYLSLMDGRTVPYDQYLARHMPHQVSEECDAIGAGKRPVTNHRVELALQGNATHHRKMVMRLARTQDWCLSLWGIGSHRSRQQGESGLVHEHYGESVQECLFLLSGHTAVRHCSIRASSRWAARSTGSWGVQPSFLSIRDTCALWYETPNSRRMTTATRAQVHTAPRNPYASAPWLNKSTF